MNICMVGTGYVGLVAGACLSDFGANVICVDQDRDKIDRLKRGEIPIYEIGLREIIERNVKLKRLHFSTDLRDAVNQCLIIFLAVGTPGNADGSADLTALRGVATEIAGYISEYKIIAIKSTVPVGTAQTFKRLIQENLSTQIDFDIVSNPEFLRQGAAVEDFMHPDRIILGSSSRRALAIMQDIYRPLYLLDTPVIITTHETAEIIKYAANTMLALKISYMNEIANLCERVSADVYDVASALGMDKRIGSKFLHPGPGFGGSCLPKDVKSMVYNAENLDYDFKLGKAIIDVNQRQKEEVVANCRKALGTFSGKIIGLLGLSFKPNTDDIRESPAIYAARRFLEEGAIVNAYDPAAMTQAKKELPNLNCFDNSYMACKEADIVIIMTEWNEFRDLQFSEIKALVRTPIIYDTRNIYEGRAIMNRGFRYICTGRTFGE